MTLTFCPPDTTQMCIYQSFLITRKFTIIPLKLCSCAWLDHELFTNILFFAFRFSTETGVIEITLPWRVSFFQHICSAIWCICLMFYSQWWCSMFFFLLILQLLGSHLPSFLFLNQFYKLIYKFCCCFFMFFVKLIWSFFCKVKSQWRNTIWY